MTTKIFIFWFLTGSDTGKNRKRQERKIFSGQKPERIATLA
jgi:hypothetical protein